MNAHTPGPWWIKDRRSTGGSLQVQAQHRGEGSSYCVAEINFWESAEANARLIAAAPDLLKTAQSLMSSIDNDPRPCTIPVFDAWCEERNHRENNLRAAIAKAEGK